jgi:rubrerythrin
MKMLRCRICGETYLGTEAPSRCPFCGADAHYFVSPGQYSSAENTIELTDSDRTDLATAIGLERSNTRYYLAMSQLAGDEWLASFYKRLSRVEAEHCSVFSKLAQTPKPSDLNDPEPAPASWCNGIAESARRETKASEFYAQVAARTSSARLSEVFNAVTAVERDHLELDALAAKHAGCEGD